MVSVAASQAFNQIMAQGRPHRSTPCKIEDIGCVDDEQTLCEAWASHQERISEIIPKLKEAVHVLEQDVEKCQLSDVASTLLGLTAQILHVFSDIDKKVAQCHTCDGQASRTTIQSEIGSSILDQNYGDTETATVEDTIDDISDLNSQLGDVAIMPMRTSDIVAMKSAIHSDTRSRSGSIVTVVALDANSGELGEVVLHVPQKHPKAFEVKEALAREYGEQCVAGVQLVIRSNGKLVPHRDTDVIRSKRTFATWSPEWLQ